MRILRNIPIALTLPVLLFVMSLAAMGMLGVTSYFGTRGVLLEEAHSSINAMAQRRADEIAQWHGETLAEIAFQADSPSTSGALRAFRAGWNAYDGEAPRVLRQAFITDNPNPENERAALDEPSVKSAYIRGHKRFHPFFRGLTERAGLADVYLFDSDGTMIYSVGKRDDYGQNIGALPDTTLSAGIAAILAAPADDIVRFSDFAPYGPAGGDLSAFVFKTVAAPDGAITGIFVARLSTAPIEQIMARTAGIGADGHAFVVRAGGAPLSHDGAVLNIAPLQDRTPLEAALGGTGGVVDVMRDRAMVTAFQPIPIEGANWVTVVESSESNLLEVAHKLRRDMLLEGAAFLAVFAVVGVILGRGLSKPLQALSCAICSIRQGDYSITVPGTARGDEIGDIAKALDSLQGYLIEAEAINTDSKIQSAAVQATSAALMMTDADFKVTHMNASILNLVRTYADDIRKIAPDFDPDDCIGKNMDIFHRAPEAIRHRVEKASGDTFQAAIPLGDVRLAIDVKPFYDEDGHVLGSVVEWSDATEETRRNAIIEAIEGGQVFAEFRLDGCYKNANESFIASAGRPEAELRAMKMINSFKRISDDDPTGEKDDTGPRIRAGETVSGLYQLNPEGRNAAPAIIEGSFSPIKTRVGKVVGFVLIGNDITTTFTEKAAAEAERVAMEKAQNEMVEQLRLGIQTLARGDLTTRLEQSFASDYEQLRSDFNEAIAGLADALTIAAEESINMRSESAEISKAAEDMATRTERQAATLRDTANALDEMTTNVRSAADGAARTEEAVGQARGRAERSEKVVSETVAAMSEIESSSQEIVKVISVIDEIAFQTNLLALNAGVEAARAGEAGRGFAVVATEVRALAQRCSDAAGEINSLLNKSGEHVERGVTLVGETGEALKHIMESVSEISGYITDIARSGREQSAGLQQINAAVMEIDQTTQQNAAMFEETSSASNALATRAQTLAQTFAQFKLNAGQISRVQETAPAASGAAAPKRAAPHAHAKPAPAKPAAKAPAPRAKPAAAARIKPKAAAVGGDTSWMANDRRTDSRRVVIDRRSGAVVEATPDNLEESWEEF